MTKYRVAKDNITGITVIFGGLYFIWIILTITSPYGTLMGKLGILMMMLIVCGWPIPVFLSFYIAISKTDIYVPKLFWHKKIAISQIKALAFKDKGMWDGIEIQYHTDAGIKIEQGPGFGFF